MDHWKQPIASRERAWAFLDKAVGADVMLLQEACPPAHRRCVGYREGGIDTDRAWGSCVDAPGLSATALSKYDGQGGTFELHETFPGSVAVVRVETEDFGDILVISVYGRLNKGWALTTVHRVSPT